MASFGELFKGGRNRRNQQNRNDEYEFYEDTHNERGEYIGNAKRQVRNNDAMNFEYRQAQQSPDISAKPLPSASDTPSARNYQNVVVYEPSNGDDVETLIDYLKRREPAIVNLDSLDEAGAQRILDFVSGAIYALNGSVHRIASNIFLLSPEGVEITVPYEPD